MEKNRINRFVQRYNLAGLIESVKWDVTDETLETSFISDDKSVLGKVSTTDFNFKNGSYGVYDTTKLTKMLSVLSNDVDIATVDIDGKTVSLNISDKGTTATYMLADLTVIPAVPDLKQLPEFDVDVSIDSSFITKFNKAKSALSDEKNFTFECKEGVGKITLGYSNVNTNRISIGVDCKCSSDIEPISFSAEFLKEILNSNRDAKSASLKISTQGLAHLNFEVDSYKSEYYLVQIQS
tara:strand:+ start:283 stop:996 length:714 start_codon:yes stop_codon:yes gene_type:complete